MLTRLKVVEKRSVSRSLAGTPRYAIFIGFVLVGVTALWLSLWDGPLSPVKVGTIGEWMAASVTVLAVYVALASSARAQQESERIRIRQRDEAAAERAVRAIFEAHIDTDDHASVGFQALKTLEDQLTIEMHVVSNTVLHNRMKVSTFLLSTCTAAQPRDPEGHPARLRMVRYIVLSLRLQLYAFWRDDPLPPWEWADADIPDDADDWPHQVWPATLDDALAFLHDQPSWTRLNS